MKPKKNQSGPGLVRKLGRGSIALGTAAFQKIPFGLGTVVSVGLHALAMPSVIHWVQATDVPNRPVSVPVVELDRSELDQLPPSMRQELDRRRAKTKAETPSEGGWDWFGARAGNQGNATVPGASVPKTKVKVPKSSTPQSSGFGSRGRSQSQASRSGSRSRSSVGGWRSPLDNYFRGNTNGNAQNRRLSRLLAQQQAEIERLREQQRRRSRNQALEGSDDKDSKVDEKPDGDDTPKGDETQTTDGKKDGQDSDASDGADEGTNGQGGEANNGDSNTGDAQPEGKGTDIPPDLPEGLRDRLAQLQGSSWEHDGRSQADRDGSFGKALGGDELTPWREAVVANQLKTAEGNIPAEVENQFWLIHTPGKTLDKPLTIPVPSALLCTLSSAPAPVRVAMLGGPDGKFVPNESPKLLTSSGYGQLDGQALEWTYRNLRNVQLTPHQGYIIHLLTLSFPTCDSSGGDPVE